MHNRIVGTSARNVHFELILLYFTTSYTLEYPLKRVLQDRLEILKDRNLKWEVLKIGQQELYQTRHGRGLKPETRK